MEIRVTVISHGLIISISSKTTGFIAPSAFMSGGLEVTYPTTIIGKVIFDIWGDQFNWKSSKRDSCDPQHSK